MWPSGAGAPPWSPGSSRDTHRGSPGPVAGQRFLEGAMRVADTRSIQRTGTGPRFAYPISLDVAGRRAVVVGAGAVALGKGDALLDAGALLTVVAGARQPPAPAAGGALRPGVGGAVGAARRGARADAAAAARHRRALPEMAPGTGAGGIGGAGARRPARAGARAAAGPPGRPAGAVAMSGGPDGDRTQLGVVYLVGAGPGDPELLTLRGAKLLARAGVVVYDRLAPRELLELAPAGAELIDAGKAPGRRGPGQEAINRLLVERARAGATVVRLKGGDPFVFGRGGEEALACVRAGVPFEVVPGVSAALADLPALAASAGIGPPATLVVGEVASLADVLAAGRWPDQDVGVLDTSFDGPAR